MIFTDLKKCDYESNEVQVSLGIHGRCVLLILDCNYKNANKKTNIRPKLKVKFFEKAKFWTANK